MTVEQISANSSRNDSLEVGYNIARMASGGYKVQRYSKRYHVAHAC